MNIQSPSKNPKSKIQNPKSQLAEPASDEAGGLEQQLTQLRGRISDIGYEIDAVKAINGLTMGGGVFAILLGGLAAYDLFNGKAGIYQPLGITPDILKWVAWGGIGLGVAALLQGVMRRRLRDAARESELARLEEEYAQLQEQQERQTHDAD